MLLNLKNFLKPAKGKLIIFGFIFLLTIFLRGVVTETELKPFEVIEKILSPHYSLYISIETWRTPWGISLLSISPNLVLGAILYYLLIILSFVIGLIYWYLIACLIIFFYEKLKGKLRKR